MTEIRLAMGFGMFATAAALAWYKTPGWGWFLFAAILTMGV